MLKISKLSIGLPEIPKAGATCVNGLFQHLADNWNKARYALMADAACLARR